MSSEKKSTDVQRALLRMRQRFNLTQQQLAEALGVRVQSVSRWECARSPSGATLHMLVSFASGIGDQESAKIFHDAAFSSVSDLPSAGKFRTAEHAISYLRTRRSYPAVQREYCKILRMLIKGLNVAIDAETEAYVTWEEANRGKKRRRQRIVAMLDPEYGIGIPAAPKGKPLSSEIPLHYLFEAQDQLRQELKNEEQETKKR